MPGRRPLRSPGRRIAGLEAIEWCGGIYSSEWGFAKLLHWLRHNPGKRARFATALEHCDMVAAVLCGIHDPAQVPRSVCAMGHKWMWNAALGGLPPEDFLTAVDPCSRVFAPNWRAGTRHPRNRRTPGAGMGGEARPARRHPHPRGRFRCALGRHRRGRALGDVVNVVGTSTCIMAIARAHLIPGVCGVVQGSIHPARTGIEAGLSATGEFSKP